MKIRRKGSAMMNKIIAEPFRSITVSVGKM